jgi:hypothetical protein
MRPTSRRACSSSGMPTWCDAMPLTKPNQQLHQELKDLGTGLDEAAEEVLRITKDCRGVDATAVLMLIARLYKDGDRIAALADEVRDGKVTRAKPE